MSDTHEAAPAATWQHLRYQRVRWLCLVSALAMTLSALGGLGSVRPLSTTVQVFGATLCLLGHELIRRGHVGAAVQALVWGLTCAFTLLIWLNSGLADPAFMAFAGVLVFGAMLQLPRAHFFSLLAFMVAQPSLLGYAMLNGLHSLPVLPLGPVRIVNYSLVLTIVGLAAWWFSRDLHRALREADAENERVRQGMAHIRFLSLHDGLTGLPNRVLAQERFVQAAEAAKRSEQQVAVLVLDLDHFKLVNDSLGHPVGDALLKAVAERLQPLIRASDTLCRFGGDEFLILLTGLEQGERASRVAAQVVDALAQPFVLEERGVNCGVSVGVALYPNDAGSFDELVKRADLAMYRAKENGRNGFRFFDAQLHAAVQEQLSLDADMRLALSLGDQFHLAYQPQFDLRSGRLAGFEALLRWQHPVHGNIPPGRFIAQAERSGFIVPLGRWVLEQACRQQHAWRAQGLHGIRVAVNVSSVQIRRGGFAELVREVLQQHALEAEAIEVELTESLLLDDSSDTARTLNALVDQGITLSIDDFGTGYSNLGYLRRFQIGRIKIDRSFVRSLDSDAHDEAIVRAIVQLGASLGIATVAEGVETAAQRERLLQLGCDQGQGFLWHPALPPAACAPLWLTPQALPEGAEIEGG